MSEYKLVPVEPTDEMRIAGARAIREHGLALAVQHSSIAYKAMLAAAPTNPPEISSTLVDELRALAAKWSLDDRGEGYREFDEFGSYNLITDNCAAELEALIERMEG